ncbi:MAG: tetratricopeptide repeat protein [Pseudomonadota bacterium]
MPPQPVLKPASSAAALGFAPIAAQARMTAPAAGQAGSRAALAKLQEAMADLKVMAVQPLLQQAVDALQADDFKTGGALAMQVLEADETNGFAWYLMAIARERAGDFGFSLRCYESALTLLPEQAEIANDLGRLAYRMGMKETAEKLFAHYLARYPMSHEAANNMACAIRDQGRFGEAIGVLTPVIQRHPENALLWNTLGSVVSEQGDLTGSITFFDEALRLDPGFAKARYNRGNARFLSGDTAEALIDCEGAMGSAMGLDETQMMRLSRSSILIALGRIAEGWEDYEARLDPNFSDVTLYAVDGPQPWTPDAELAGKTFLLFGEQGLGDEVMFANTVPDMLEALGPDGTLLIAVEPRLVSLFQRSFPTAQVGTHSTWNIDAKTVRGAPFVDNIEGIDLWAPIGSLLRRFRPTVESFPGQGRFLKADPARVAYWRAQLDALPGPKVGLLWKSLVKNGARHRFFSPFEQWAPVLATPGVTFVNLQYGDCSAEIEDARRELGVDIWTPPGIDLKQDLDDVAALCCALDLVVGPSNASSCLAGACGAPLWLIATPGAWTLLGTDRYPWYPQARVFLPPAFGQWGPAMDAIADALTVAFPTGTKAALAG